MKCVVCGSEDFVSNNVIWDELAEEWGIDHLERSYIDRQQGTQCSDCGCNIRSQALARSIMRHWSWSAKFADFVVASKDKKVLELNECAQLSSYLKRMPGRILAEYPEVDMHSLPYADETFDLVVHSDTLEHVDNPVKALSECRRVLKPGGLLAYTVPIIVGRLTRDRTGLPKSYHGAPSSNASDFLVITEYGADAWKHVIEAGFDEVSLSTFDYPAGIAISASRSSDQSSGNFWLGKLLSRGKKS
ncbi:methyltransferase domain-containing protein [Rhizobium sp. NFACC06-2]|uniref:methyltransferase domain-containing protein n=1 Tax=Rhizobium sp. NFACC06-2 TaxID=1566264 RepID=UPI00087654AD|nr:methyltransferase domain-containing protein [Rhizobium sp. NFACC06-2]SCY42918.1 Methyltransferase domain-containing protein [Rhizobium sp. NFACC06-2]